jgi:hypothetical protein
MVAMARRRNRALVHQSSLTSGRETAGDCLLTIIRLIGMVCPHCLLLGAPVAHMREARRVLRDGGRFVLGFRPASVESAAGLPLRSSTFRPPERIHRMLLEAGIFRA